MSQKTQLARFTRWQEWVPRTFALIWPLSLYFAVAYNIPAGAFALTFMVFTVFACSQAAFAYLLNDWGDRALDRRQFKANAFNGLSPLESTLALTLLVVIALIAGIPLLPRTGFALLWLTWLVAAVSLYIEPLRLKGRGAAGLVVSAVAQGFLPVLMGFAIFQVAGGMDMWILALGFMLHVLAREFGHQRDRRTRNIATKVGTFATGLANSQIDRLYSVFLFVDKLAIGAISIVAAHAISRLLLPVTFYLALAPIVLFSILYFSLLKGALASMEGEQVEDPYFTLNHPASVLLHQYHLDFILPAILGLTAMLLSPFYTLFLGLFIAGRVLLVGFELQFPAYSLSWARQVIRRRSEQDRREAGD